jgi:hypothetical protein
VGLRSERQSFHFDGGDKCEATATGNAKRRDDVVENHRILNEGEDVRHRSEVGGRRADSMINQRKFGSCHGCHNETFFPSRSYRTQKSWALRHTVYNLKDRMASRSCYPYLSSHPLSGYPIFPHHHASPSTKAEGPSGKWISSLSQHPSDSLARKDTRCCPWVYLRVSSPSSGAGVFRFNCPPRRGFRKPSICEGRAKILKESEAKSHPRLYRGHRS